MNFEGKPRYRHDGKQWNLVDLAGRPMLVIRAPRRILRCGWIWIPMLTA